MTNTFTITPSYESSWTSMGSTQLTNYNAVLAQVLSDLSSAITPANTTNIGIQFGYGTYAGQTMDGSAAGQSAYYVGPVGYTTIRNALRASSGNSTLMATAYSDTNFPSSDFFGGSETIYNTFFYASATGTGSAVTNGSINGFVGVSTSIGWTTALDHGATAGSLYGVLMHEITECMGRFGKLGNSGQYGPCDMFSFSGTGTRSFTSSSGRYMSTDGQSAIAHMFDNGGNPNNGDAYDSTESGDFFNAFYSGSAVSRSSSLPLKDYDWQWLNLIGYPLSATGLTWAGLSSDPPTNSVIPVISGTATAGNTLTSDTGTWNNTPTSYAYQWKKNNSNVGSNSSTSPTLTNSDRDAIITIDVTATNSGGSDTATSLGKGPVLVTTKPSPFLK